MSDPIAQTEILLEDLLRFYAEAGCDGAVESDPVNHFAAFEAQKQMADQKRAEMMANYQQEREERQNDRAVPHSQGDTRPAAPPRPTLPDSATIKSASEAANSAQSLKELKSALVNFEGCNLKMTAKNMVFADGNPESRLMLIGEAPGRDEDLQGLPFVGRSGQLLDRMLGAIGHDRTSVYISNIIPWRPPGNRTPTIQEVAMCLPFIQRHIALVKPEMIVCLGGSSAKALMDVKEGIMRLRGNWHNFDSGDQTIPLLPTLHPAYLLRNPAHKRLAWHDFLMLKAKLNEGV